MFTGSISVKVLKNKVIKVVLLTNPAWLELLPLGVIALLTFLSKRLERLTIQVLSNLLILKLLLQIINATYCQI